MDWDIRIGKGPKIPNGSALDKFFQRAKNNITNIEKDFQVRSIGIDEESTGLILDFICKGLKIGTFSLPWVSDAEGYGETITGTYIILTDYYGVPKMIVEIQNPFLTTFGDIGPDVTKLDGPPVQDINIWKPLHREYWNGLLLEYGKECTNDMPVIVEPFKLVYEEAN